jgi:uncharacterized protein YjbJ (UPF0337 family)
VDLKAVVEAITYGCLAKSYLGDRLMTTASAYKRSIKQLLLRTVCLCLLMVTAWVSFDAPAAQAVGSQRAGEVMNRRAAAELDRKAGEGTSDKVGGAIDSATGKVRRGIGEAKDEMDDSSHFRDKVKGEGYELRGEMKRDIGNAKSAAADAKEDLKENAADLKESVKDFFNRD